MFLDCKLVGEELKSLRNRQNKSIEKVSNDLGIHFNTLSKYEKDASNMTLELLEKVLNYYGIDELIFFKVIREYNHVKGE